MSTLPVPIPLTEPIAKKKNRKKFPRPEDVDPLEGTLPTVWAEYLASQAKSISEALRRTGTVVELTSQNASISATDMSGGALSSGLYALTWYARITQAASTSSSLTITVDYTSGGVSPTYSGAAITGNTTTTIQADGLELFHVDDASPVRYATTYASVGATAMQYELRLVLLRVQA